MGTTDNDYEERDLDHVPASGDDVEYLLDAVNSFFGTDLGADDLVGAYAGVRPLISTGDPKKSVDISRKAELYETSSGLVTITGGKLTTWRRMAKMAVDRLVEREGRESPCRTHEIPLGLPIDAGGAARGAGRGRGQPRAPRRLATAMPPHDVMELAAGDPALAAAGEPGAARPGGGGRLRGPARAGAVAGGRAAAPHAAGAARRARAVGPGADGTVRAARAVAGELGWSDERVRGRAGRLARGGACGGARADAAPVEAARGAPEEAA